EVAMHRDLPDDRVVSVGGARLAAGLMQLDLIDEYRQFISPVIVGGGTPYFPPLDHPLDLELLETRTFGSRVIYARYRRIRPVRLRAALKRRKGVARLSATRELHSPRLHTNRQASL